MRTTKIVTIQPTPDLLDIAQTAGGLPGVFSCNEFRHVWPFATWSRTPLSQRRYLQGSIRLLDEIVDVVLATRPEGGRFRLTDRGVWLVATERQVAVFSQVMWRVA